MLMKNATLKSTFARQKLKLAKVGSSVAFFMSMMWYDLHKETAANREDHGNV